MVFHRTLRKSLTERMTFEPRRKESSARRVFRGWGARKCTVLGSQRACGFEGPQVIADVHRTVNGRSGGKNNKGTGHVGLGGFLSFYSETVGKQLRGFM